jgi:hypothetical protein
MIIFARPYLGNRNIAFTQLWMDRLSNRPPLVAMVLIKIALMMIIAGIPMVMLFNVRGLFLLIIPAVIFLIARSDFIATYYLQLETRFLANLNQKTMDDIEVFEDDGSGEGPYADEYYGGEYYVEDKNVGESFMEPEQEIVVDDYYVDYYDDSYYDDYYDDSYYDDYYDDSYYDDYYDDSYYDDYYDDEYYDDDYYDDDYYYDDYYDDDYYDDDYYYDEDDYYYDEDPSEDFYEDDYYDDYYGDDYYYGEEYYEYY